MVQPVQEHFSATCARLYCCAHSTKTPTGSSQLKQLPATISYSGKQPAAFFVLLFTSLSMSLAGIRTRSPTLTVSWIAD